MKAIEDNATGADGEVGAGDNNNEDSFDLGHQQQQESSTPTPDARSGTAGSRKLQPASMQPTVMEVGRSSRLERKSGMPTSEVRPAGLCKFFSKWTYFGLAVFSTLRTLAHPSVVVPQAAGEGGTLISKI